MKLRIPDLLLLLVVLIGAVPAWQTSWERSRLQSQYDRLVSSAGDLPIEDPTKVYVRAIETGQPLHFAWRFYLPPNYLLKIRDGSGGSSASVSTAPAEFIARVKFRESEKGGLQVYTHFFGGSGQSSLGSRDMVKLLHGRWDKVLVEQLGAPEFAVLDPDRPASLLRLTLPEDLRAEARKTLDRYSQERYVPVLYEIKLGPETPEP
jgi:hypothetical protein